MVGNVLEPFVCINERGVRWCNRNNVCKVVHVRFVTCSRTRHFSKEVDIVQHHQGGLCLEQSDNVFALCSCYVMNRSTNI